MEVVRLCEVGRDFVVYWLVYLCNCRQGPDRCSEVVWRTSVVVVVVVVVVMISVVVDVVVVVAQNVEQDVCGTRRRNDRR